MKKYSIFTLFLLAVVMFSGCKKDYSSVGDWPSKAAGLEGTWKATKMVQIDYVAEKAGADLYQMDLSDLYNATDFIITFQASGQFTISGTAHNFCKLNSGTWKFDDPSFPSKIVLTNAGVTENFAVIAPPRTGWDNCVISYDRYSSGKKIIGYQYYLKKQ